MNKSYENNKIKIINAYNNLLRLPRKKKWKLLRFGTSYLNYFQSIIMIKPIIHYYVNLAKQYTRIILMTSISSCNCNWNKKGKKILIYFLLARFSKYKAIENKRQVSSPIYIHSKFLKRNLCFLEL